MKWVGREKYAPERASRFASGYDIKAAGDYILRPFEPVMIDTGIKIEFCEGWHCHMYLRSSVGKKGIIMLNSVGIIDPDYRGNIGMMVMNINTKTKGFLDDVPTFSESGDFNGMSTINQQHLIKGDDISIKDGERIGQLVFTEARHPDIWHVDSLDETERGSGGFGSTN